MKYINQKTGAVVESPFVITGGDWVNEETDLMVTEEIGDGFEDEIEKEIGNGIEEDTEADLEKEIGNGIEEDTETNLEDEIDLRKLSKKELVEFANGYNLNVTGKTKDQVLEIIINYLEKE